MKNTESDEEGYLYCHISACAQLDYAQLHILTVDAYRVKYRRGENKSLVILFSKSSSRNYIRKLIEQSSKTISIFHEYT